MNDSVWEYVIGLFFGILVAMLFSSIWGEFISNNSIKAQSAFEWEGKVYTCVIDSAATDALHNWRAK